MKKLFILFFVAVNLCTAYAQTTKQLAQVLTLQMPEGNGSNGAAVAWHEKNSSYYAAFAGNAEFPIAQFDAKGKLLSEADTKFDVRGLWYNANAANIEGNAFAGEGIFSLILSNKGEVENARALLMSSNAPFDNACAVFDAKKKQILFFDGQGVVRYNEKTEQIGKILNLQKDENNDYNSTSLIYTGIKKAEIGLLNVTKKRIEFFDAKKGKLNAVWNLPESAVIEDMFNFAYANGIVWLFDKENRTWVGYR